MKKILKIFSVTLLSCACLLTACACTNKSECNAEYEPDTRASEPMPLPEYPDCPTCPAQPENPGCPDCPTVPEDPDKQQPSENPDGDPDDKKPRPYPMPRRRKFRLLPFEIIFGEYEDGYYYFVIPAHG